ncbi:hypothetical protein, partial [Pseudomonas aeruginosa]|uniref:hypothetical protein n=1 Tax=Pseudomonas aeruginosa TaxID=287 RepID=UPI002F92B7B4
SPVAPAAWPTPSARTPDLERLAVEAWLDGCIGERAAAEVARQSDARDRLTRQTLSRAAADETEHARLAWDVLSFALAKGGRPVARA